MVIPLVKVKACSPAREELTQEVYSLFHSGSQLSFATERLAKKPNISVYENGRLKLHTFAATNSIQFVLLKTEVNLQLCNRKSVKLCLNIIGNMTTKLSRRSKDSYGMAMAGEAVKPDILIGQMIAES